MDAAHAHPESDAVRIEMKSVVHKHLSIEVDSKRHGLSHSIKLVTNLECGHLALQQRRHPAHPFSADASGINFDFGNSRLALNEETTRAIDTRGIPPRPSVDLDGELLPLSHSDPPRAIDTRVNSPLISTTYNLALVHVILCFRALGDRQPPSFSADDTRACVPERIRHREHRGYSQAATQMVQKPLPVLWLFMKPLSWKETIAHCWQALATRLPPIRALPFVEWQLFQDIKHWPRMVPLNVHARHSQQDPTFFVHDSLVVNDVSTFYTSLRRLILSTSHVQPI
ncbi:unnamed protein product [Mycena citricolor]|uniref:Uncharacterized protein n=1 Tax=Mycena citricolor TaxID=2018698 RepID=A0AAD2GWE1_9AGAR|nr:unnamed protein product [Mycena citricolor]